ncbi:hypothetical protein N7520_010685 [Penicillium odoratum]|uniref:uncharacterized protein n=1 Tax=Penicillium odoratum TaxID=1167516 RepID=UPI00254957EC|nr:uncharacterized protein N7520_010685 [Penicillium odoratum]KAJ5745503.1 hypothetical protein N7520_010685 [Penicillium odoratum]
MAESNKKRRLSQDSPQDTDAKMDVTKTDATDASAPDQPKRTLFVRSLPTSATTESLAEYFSQSYVIKHATVVSDPQTKKSKGYGFVTFADLEDAESALKELNGSTFDGKKIRVDYAKARQREIDEKLGKSVPSAATLKSKQEREDYRTNAPPKLIVRNLPWSIKEPADLVALFRSFGLVKYATLPKKGNTLAGFGFVTIRGKKNAEKALQMVNGKEIDGRTLAVDWAVEKDVWDTQQKEEEKEQEKEKEKDEEEEESDVKMKDDEASEEVSEDEGSADEEENEDEDMEDLEDLGDAEEEEEEEEEDDRNNSTIFLRNLPFTCDDEALYEHFKQFGPLRYARIVVDHETERPRGTGFVCFWKPEDAITCVRGAPKPTVAAPTGKDRNNPAMKHSVLQNDNSDPSGRYTLDGRVLQVARAVNKREATRLEEEGVSHRLVRDKDKRRLYLLSEGTIPSNSPLYKKLSPSEIKMREESHNHRQTVIKKNPALHLSLCRLSVRNIPKHITSKDLKQLAREAVVGFATEVKKDLRQPLSKEEVLRSADTMKELEQLRKEKRVGIVRQAMIVYETREGTKVPEKGGGGRSRGYGFIEYYTHRHALMGLRWLNCHAVDIPASAQAEGEKEKKKRLIVEFAIENAQVIKRRQELQEKKEKEKEEKEKAKAKAEEEMAGQKRKRAAEKEAAKEAEAEEENKLAKRARIIAKKRMQRRGRKGN